MVDSAGGPSYWRPLDQFDEQLSELCRVAELARQQTAAAIYQTTELLLDAADAHEQAAIAYELAGGHEHTRDHQARAMRHRQAAALRRATAASLASRAPKTRDSDDRPLLLDAHIAHVTRALQATALNAAAQLERQADRARPPARLDYQAEIKRWLAFAEEAEQMARRWEQPP
jgi:hypothetical protein